MFFYNNEKHVFMFFYLQINVFNIYGKKVAEIKHFRLWALKDRVKRRVCNKRSGCWNLLFTKSANKFRPQQRGWSERYDRDDNRDELDDWENNRYDSQLTSRLRVTASIGLCHDYTRATQTSSFRSQWQTVYYVFSNKNVFSSLTLLKNSAKFWTSLARGANKCKMGRIVHYDSRAPLYWLTGQDEGD